MTTFVSESPDQRVINEADAAAIRDLVRGAGVDGLPLNRLFDQLAAEGHSLPSLSTAVMYLIHKRHLDLTAERRLRWIESA